MPTEASTSTGSTAPPASTCLTRGRPRRWRRRSATRTIESRSRRRSRPSRRAWPPARSEGEATYGVTYGIDGGNLVDAGWGVIFPHDIDPAVGEALCPLLERRRGQAGAIKPERFREFAGHLGYRSGEARPTSLLATGSPSTCRLPRTTVSHTTCCWSPPRPSSRTGSSTNWMSSTRSAGCGSSCPTGRPTWRRSTVTL